MASHLDHPACQASPQEEGLVVPCQGPCLEVELELQERSDEPQEARSEWEHARKSTWETARRAKEGCPKPSTSSHAWGLFTSSFDGGSSGGSRGLGGFGSGGGGFGVGLCLGPNRPAFAFATRLTQRKGGDRPRKSRHWTKPPRR